MKELSDRVGTLRVGRPEVVAASAVLILVAALLRVAVAAGPPPATVVEPTFSDSDVQNASVALEDAILIDHQQSILPAGFIPGKLSAEQSRQLDARIVDAYTTRFSDQALSRRLGDLRSWAADISSRPTLRTLTARLDRFDLRSTTSSATGLIISASYMVYQVTAQGTLDDELIWGGWVTVSITAEMRSASGRWSVRNYTEQQTDTRNDPSVARGWTSP